MKHTKDDFTWFIGRRMVVTIARSGVVTFLDESQINFFNLFSFPESNRGVLMILGTLEKPINY